MTSGTAEAHSTAAATGDSAAALAHVRGVVDRSGTSFLYGMRILPQERRDAMYAVYAFCREIDDIADDEGDTAGKLGRLDDWRVEIDRLYEGRPTYPTARALARPVERYRLPKDEFLELIAGMEMDAREAMRGPSQEDLTLYCRRVAGAVGLLSIRVFGAAGPAARQFALALGEALQLTNILRDLGEDAERGRLYLPAELLDKYAIAAREPNAVLAHRGISGVCSDLALQASRRFAAADRVLVDCDRRRLRPALLMMGVYDRLLARLERRGWDDPARPLRLSKPEKIWAALRHGLWRPSWRAST